MATTRLLFIVFAILVSSGEMYGDDVYRSLIEHYMYSGTATG